jgi:ABC-type lipoprotein export system ATPase subunit
MIELIGVKKSYPVYGKATGQCVLDNIDLKVEAGQTLAIVGPSGSGKSTLLNMMGALDIPDEGKVIFENKELKDADDKTLADIRNKRIGFVFQQHHLLPQLTVLENILLPTIASESAGPKEKQRAEELLEKVGLSDWSKHLPGELSGGQKQRVAVVRALINSPGILLADEPTGSLDSEASENIAELLLEMNKTEGVALVVVTHSMKLAEKMSKITLLDNGVLTEK